MGLAVLSVSCLVSGAPRLLQKRCESQRQVCRVPWSSGTLFGDILHPTDGNVRRMKCEYLWCVCSRKYVVKCVRVCVFLMRCTCSPCSPKRLQLASETTSRPSVLQWRVWWGNSVASLHVSWWRRNWKPELKVSEVWLWKSVEHMPGHQGRTRSGTYRKSKMQRFSGIEAGKEWQGCLHVQFLPWAHNM